VISSRVFYEKGIEEGKIEGIRKGRVEGKVETALKLISKSASLDTILYLTDLDVAFITELKNRPNIDLGSALSFYYEIQR
jgi:predicted transposase/invertase (TIGR01784 family)